MKGEASGVLNRLLDGLVDWRVNGLKEPESVRGATADYREEKRSAGPLPRHLHARGARRTGAVVEALRAVHRMGARVR